MRRTTSFAALCAIAAIAAGCASPTARFYTLSATSVPAGTPVARTAGLSVYVATVSIPALLDRPQIVVRTGPNQVAFEDFNRWAAPLADDISRVLALDLMASLGTQRVSRAPQSSNADADYRVSVEVQGFESASGQDAALNAVWTVRRARDGKILSGRTSTREPAGGDGFDALAAAHSRAIARLSQDIADTIRSLQEGAP